MTPAQASSGTILSQGRAAVYEEPIGPAGVRIQERPRTEAAPGAVAIAIKAASINHLDLWLAHGAQRIPPPRVIAADGAGVVQSSGDPAWRAGDEVVIFPTLCCWECEWCRAGQNVKCPQFGVLGEHSDGTACELIHIDARNVFRKPAGLSWPEAAAFPLTFLTAWRMLTTRAQLRADETVLATSRSESKRRRALELGAEAVFESADFSHAVRRATGDGVDVVFEHVGPATLEESMRSLAMGGRIVTCGSTSGVKAEVSMPRLFFRQAGLLGSTMGNADEFEAVLKAIDGGMRPVLDSTYPLSDVKAALMRLDSAEQFGKVVLSVSDGV
jgi:NADPH:quinone reductase-like Zn-dependent oxidoreductase